MCVVMHQSVCVYTLVYCTCVCVQLCITVCVYTLVYRTCVCVQLCITLCVHVCVYTGTLHTHVCTVMCHSVCVCVCVCTRTHWCIGMASDARSRAQRPERRRLLSPRAGSGPHPCSVPGLPAISVLIPVRCRLFMLP